ncbi:hypothetical protein HDU96_007389 [Phlyctochytrium bullatum]|nr:hypothetical protein HDU96_007389 [Phlyctochytrium bullatum]
MEGDDLAPTSQFLIKPPSKRKKTRPPKNVRTARLTDAVHDYQSQVQESAVQIKASDEAEGESKDEAEKENTRKTKPKKKQKKAASDAVEIPKAPPVDIPPEFSRILDIFPCMNVVHSFITSQRENPCTFEALKSGIEALRKDPFTMEDLGMIVAIFSVAIEVNWAPRSSLQDACLQELKMAAGVKGTEGDKDGKYQLGEDIYALLVDFKDIRPLRIGQKSRTMDEKGRRVGAKYESLVKQASRAASKCAGLPKAIEERNERFRKALEAFVLRAKQTQSNPWFLLKESALDAIPTDPGARREVYKAVPISVTDTKPGDLKTFVDFLQTDEEFENQRIEGGSKTVPAKIAEYGG